MSKQYQRYQVNVLDDEARLFIDSGGQMQIVTNRVPFDLLHFFQMVEYWRGLWAGLQAGQSHIGFKVFDILAGMVGVEDLRRWGIESPAWLLPEDEV